MAAENTTTTTLQTLNSAVTDTLEYSGVLPSMRSQLREKIFNLLQEDDVSPPGDEPSENVLINELILQYLNWNGHHTTASIFATETNHKPNSLPHTFLESELGVTQKEDADVPLLYGVVETMRSLKSDRAAYQEEEVESDGNDEEVEGKENSRLENTSRGTMRETYGSSSFSAKKDFSKDPQPIQF